MAVCGFMLHSEGKTPRRGNIFLQKNIFFGKYFLGDWRPRGEMNRKNETHVETRALPACLVRALSAAGYRRPDVPVIPAPTVQIGGGAVFSGNRAVAVAVNLETGEIGQLLTGSWGGPNPFEPRSIDHDRNDYQIPRNGAVIVGESGGRGAFCRVYVHPSAVLGALQAAGGEQVTPREAAILAVFKGIKGGFRQKYLAAGAVEQPEIDKLAAAEYLKINRAGAVRITPKGKNVAAKHTPSSWKWPAEIMPA